MWKHTSFYIFGALGLLFCQATKDVNKSKCIQSIPTEAIVESCPRNSREWILAKERKKCHLIYQNCSSPEKFQYHCLPNKYLDKFVEVCAPTRLIVGNHCPFYEIESQNIEHNVYQPCKSHAIRCPEVYESYLVYRYQECFKEISENTKKQISEETASKYYVSYTQTWGFVVINANLIGVLFMILIQVVIIHRRCSKQESYTCCTIITKANTNCNTIKGEPEMETLMDKNDENIVSK